MKEENLRRIGIYEERLRALKASIKDLESRLEEDERLLYSQHQDEESDELLHNAICRTQIRLSRLLDDQEALAAKITSLEQD